MVNPGEFVGGAGLGTALSILCDGLIDLVQKTCEFKSHFKNIESTLQRLKPVLAQMADSNLALSYVDVNELNGLDGILKEGNVLVEKCKKVKKWNIIKKYRYEYKLISWEESIQKHIGEVSVLQGLRDGKKTAVSVNGIVAEVNSIAAKTDFVVDEVKKLKGLTGNIEVSTNEIEVSTKKTHATVDNVNDEIKSMKVSTGKIEFSTQRLEVATQITNDMVDNVNKEMQNMKLSTENIEFSTNIIEVTAKKTEVVVDNVNKEIHNMKVSTENIEFSTNIIEVTAKKTEVVVDNVNKEIHNMKVSTENIEFSTKRIEVTIDALAEDLTERKRQAELNLLEKELFKPWCAVPIHDPDDLFGLDAPLIELKEKLLKDEGSSKLVLTGLAGCGKTTLASKFCLDQEVKDKFGDNIVFLAITKEPNVDLIIQQLYQQKGKKVPAFTNAETLVQMFIRNEAKKPLLLVLDDVWSGSESFLQLFDLRITDYKVLVTSRSQFEGFGSTFELMLLDDDTAMKLFSHFASLSNKSKHIQEDVARQIVKYCEGLPVALKSIGELLSGKPESFWRAKLAQWSRGSSSIFEPKNQLLHCLQSSILELDEITRNCFLDLGLFPQIKYISVATLFDMWVELYSLRGDDECVAKLYELSSRSLAKFGHGRELNIDANGYYSQHFVIQHGLFRELAIYISKQVEKEENRKRLLIEISEENHPKWWRKQITMEAQLLSVSTSCPISISNDESLSLEWPNIELPNAEVLILSFQTQEYVLPKFMEKMPELKVLVVTGYHISGGVLKSWIHPQNQHSNLKTIILEGISIPSITKSLTTPIPLKSVKKISLSRCYKVSEAFRDHSVQISGMFPNLQVMNIDFCDLVELPADLGSLIFLRELNITNCSGLSTLPQGLENLVDLEVLRLRFCKDFSKFQHSVKFASLRTIDLAYCSSLKELPKNIGELGSLRKIDTRNCTALKELPRSISNVRHLEVVICSAKTKLLTECLPHGKNIPMEAPTLSWDDFCE